MSEDAPVNTGAAGWPDADSAYFAVRRMQTKLYRWATEDHGRRFGDLFNLVYDPAFLVALLASTGPRWPRSRPVWGSRGSWARSRTR
jgi:hypothetical protein